jgi:hypothetical protein
MMATLPISLAGFIPHLTMCSAANYRRGHNLSPHPLGLVPQSQTAERTH